MAKLRKYYVYVPKDVLPSIKKHGYLSVLAQKKKFGSLSAEVIAKYKGQMEDAIKTYDELKDLLDGKSEEDKIIAYLDWRMKGEIPDNRRGSNAIYILYFPIPDEPDIMEFVKKKRKFTVDRVLLMGETAAEFYPIPSDETPPTREQCEDRAFWVRKWNAQIKANVKDALWLEGIPHACIFPANGTIPFLNLHVKDALFV